MNLQERFIKFIKENHLFTQKDKLLLAVSGGVDSVVLCELCKQAGFDFAILHCNFQLRGEESERDEKFVRALAEKYNVEVLVKKFDVPEYVKLHKTGVQEAARNLRYEWFLELVAARTFSTPAPGWKITIDPSRQKTYVLTAHHANDSIETFLMNFFKGTGIKGLRGILPKHELLAYLKRSLIFAKKDELLQFAAEGQLSFLEDSSNASNKYTRNYFRNEVIPAIEKIFPEVENNLLASIERFKEIEILYTQAINLYKKKLLEAKGKEVHIPVLKLLQTKPLKTVLFEIIKDYGFTSHQTEDVTALLQSESGKYVQSFTHRIIRNRKWLIISPNKTEEADNVLIEDDDKEIFFKGGSLQLMLNNQYSIINNQLIAQLDAAEIKFPLLLRKWKQGDYFYPLGMQKKKKLSRFFIDQKLSLTDKEKVWVLESNKKILWVIGLRIDDRFKITTTTKTVLQVTFKTTDA